MRIVSEQEFKLRLETLIRSEWCDDIGMVTGPGRSGAVAAVYASHIMQVPFIPFLCDPPAGLGRLLIVDTARESGETLKKAARRYAGHNPYVLAVFEEPPRVAFWYEALKPQRYRHDRICARMQRQYDAA